MPADPGVASNAGIRSTSCAPRRWNGAASRAAGARWYVTEHIVRAMRAYGWTIIVGALGQPILYLLGLAVGLAALIDAPITDASGMRGVVPRLRRAGAADDGGDPGGDRGVHAIRSWTASSGGGSSSGSARRRSRSPQIATGVAVRRVRPHRSSPSPGYYLFLWIFGAVPDPSTGWLAIPIGLLGGLGVRHAADGVRRVDRGRQGPVRARPALRLHADVPVLGHLLPARRRCRCGCSGSAGSRRCGTRPSSAASSPTGCPREPLG